MRIAKAAGCVVGLALISAPAMGQLYSDAMESGAGWGVNATGTDFAATFGYDYSVDGIPEAPSSGGGDLATRGLKMEANLTSGTLQAFSAYPLGQNFTGNYTLRFDAWMNFDADEVATGSSVGTTEFLGGGIGYNNIMADVGSGVQAIATGDGGSASDWRAFNPAFLAAADMTAGDRNGANAYYADFLPSVAAPAAQGQAAGSVAGSPGLQWITWQFAVNGSTVSVDIIRPDNSSLRIADIDASAISTDGNISLFYADFFTSVSPRPDRTFGLIDNVVVVPAPGAAGLAGVAGLMLLRRRR